PLITKKIFTPVVATPAPANAGPASPVRRKACPKMTSSAANSRSASNALSCFMFDGDGGGSSAQADKTCGLPERLEEEVREAAEFGALRAEPEFELLVLLRHVERAEDPVPHREAETEVL